MTSVIKVVKIFILASTKAGYVGTERAFVNFKDVMCNLMGTLKFKRMQ